MEQPATLVKYEGISQQGRRYVCALVMWRGQEIGRLFLRPLEIEALFGGGGEI